MDRKWMQKSRGTFAGAIPWAERKSATCRTASLEISCRTSPRLPGWARLIPQLLCQIRLLRRSMNSRCSLMRETECSSPRPDVPIFVRLKGLDEFEAFHFPDQQLALRSSSPYVFPYGI